MTKFNKDLSFDEKMKIVQKEVSEEKEYLNHLSFDPKPVIEIVKRYIDLWDPVLLLAMECPEDEYESEIRTISIYITKHMDDLDVIKLERQLREVFENTFEEVIVQDHRSIDTATRIHTAIRDLTK
ncbi:hypothetical protein [Paenibacillus glycanilyticus]|uniref:Uncharacterized protein n=1 Tax=Paenibacillus glycanilyticus TaxID=126569 RepID=A0ABQ6G8J8_9BACL|nr:hypothetical protein [Paenibacillus glycanilyticus]GLX66590.1 hypothetical protein MU1_09340 [Paenibacillus glycanilyticus]